MTVTEFRRRGDAIAAHESKWYHHTNAVSYMLRFKDLKLFDEYISSLEKGGTGSKKKAKGGSTFVPNIYGKMKLRGRQDNVLHFNYEKFGDGKIRFYSFGRFKEGSNIAEFKLADQMQMIKHVKGEARHLSDEERRCRSEGWTKCIMDKRTRGDYYNVEFPKIIMKFKHMWEKEIVPLDDGNVSPLDKELVRKEIKFALRCSNELLDYFPEKLGFYPRRIFNLPHSVPLPSLSDLWPSPSVPSPLGQDGSPLQRNQQAIVVGNVVDSTQVVARPEASPNTARRQIEARRRADRSRRRSGDSTEEERLADEREEQRREMKKASQATDDTDD